METVISPSRTVICSFESDDLHTGSAAAEAVNVQIASTMTAGHRWTIPVPRSVTARPAGHYGMPRERKQFAIWRMATTGLNDFAPVPAEGIAL